MFLYKYNTDKNGHLSKELSMFCAEPAFTINMPDGEQAPVFDPETFPFEIYMDAPTFKKRGKKRDNVSYIDLAAAFDIETTTIQNNDKPFAFMFQWQFCIEDYVFMGRTWQEFQRFIQILHERLDIYVFEDGDKLEGRALVCMIHNMNFEFQFTRYFIGDIVKPIVTDKYCPLLIPTALGIVYRCSYRLTNKSLESFTKGFPHAKLAGDFDYSVIRTPKTKLTDLEYAYCYNDVKGLCEAFRDRLEKDKKYNIANIPLTSTGYVRKACQQSMHKSPANHKRFIDSKLSPHLYKLCRRAFRGGNTHTNSRFTGVLVGRPELGGIGGDIHHADIASSYPTQILVSNNFPLGPFIPMDPAEVLPNFDKLCSQYCLLVVIRMKDIKYRGTCGIPYIAKSKTITRIDDKDKIIEDNGRIFAAPFVEIACTEIDLRYILRDYEASEVIVTEAYKSHKGRLPWELRRVCLEYYKKKTALKHVKSEDGSIEYEYARSKEMLNSCYGMMAQRVDHVSYDYINGDYIIKPQTLNEQLDKFYESRSSFLPYQYGVWVTSLSRQALQVGLDICGPDTIYCDTDSVFFIGDHQAEFDELNRQLTEAATKAGAIAETKNGELMPCGIWDFEPDCKLFKSLGAKKYLLSYDGVNIESTIAGVSKKLGAAFFTEHGFDAFTNETTIETSGKLAAKYNNDLPHYIEVNGVTILTASNVALVEGPYTIHIKHDYTDFYQYIQRSLSEYYGKE